MSRFVQVCSHDPIFYTILKIKFKTFYLTQIGQLFQKNVNIMVFG